MISKVKYHSVNKYSLLILTLFAFYCYTSILENSLLPMRSLMQFIKVTTFGIGLAIWISCVRRNVKLLKVIIITCILLFFAFASLKTGRAYILVFAVFILLGEYVNFDDVVKTALIFSVFGLVTILVLCGLGVIQDYIYISNNKDRVAHCLGFSYYSSFPYIAFYCFIEYLYLKKNKTTFFDYLVILVLNHILYRLTTVRLTYYLTYAILFLDFSLKHTLKIHLNKKVYCTVSAILYPVCIIVVFFIMKYYSPENQFFASMNKILGGRLSLMHQGYVLYPFSLFGNNIEMRGNSALHVTVEYFYIDSGFAYSLLGYGGLFSIIVTYLYSVIYVFSCKTNNKALFIWTTAVLIFTIVNNTWVSIGYNPVLMISISSLTALGKKGKVGILPIKIINLGS